MTTEIKQAVFSQFVAGSACGDCMWLMRCRTGNGDESHGCSTTQADNCPRIKAAFSSPEIDLGKLPAFLQRQAS